MTRGQGERLKTNELTTAAFIDHARLVAGAAHQAREPASWTLAAWGRLR